MFSLIFEKQEAKGSISWCRGQDEREGSEVVIKEVDYSTIVCYFIVLKLQSLIDEKESNSSFIFQSHILISNSESSK